MNASQVVEQYIRYKQSLGMRFRSQAVVLRAFSRFIGDVPLKKIRPDQVGAFLDGSRPITRFWHVKHSALSGLYRFAIARGFANESPLPRQRAKLPPPFTPYIFTPEELRRLLEATVSYRKPKDPSMDALTFRMLLLLLYGAGLRISEAVSLKTTDVDLQERVLTIQESKFYKARLVPIGPRLATLLTDYADQRRSGSDAQSGSQPFLVKARGRAITRGDAEKAFQHLRAQAGVIRRDGARYQPRLHDLRHTFAVHRLVSWYRAGVDVQNLLPRLSTYLGHVSLAGTQRYLTMTPELLTEAGKRFEAYVQEEVSHA